MVYSQVYSQAASHSEFSNVHQHRSRAPSNAEMNQQEPKTSQGNWLGNTTFDGRLWSSEGYACLEHANTTSPFKSSWIQRLIPSYNARMEQPQPSDKLSREHYGIDGVQANCKQSAAHLSILRNQSDYAVYENSRIRNQEVFSSHRTYVCTNMLGCVRNGDNMAANSTQFDAQPLEIQVSPKLLPVVKSLLPGSSKNFAEKEMLMETNMPHNFSGHRGYVNPMAQTVHYYANEKSRVSCSSIGGVSSRGVVHASGDFLALESLQLGKRCINPSLSLLELPFNNIHAVTQSNMDPTFGGKDRQTCTSLRTNKNLTQEDPLNALRTESWYPEIHDGWAAFTARSRSGENRLLDTSSMPFRAEGSGSLRDCFSETKISTSKMDEKLAFGCSIDQPTRSKAVSKRNCWNPKECHSYAIDGSEALYAREDSFNGGWWPIPNKEKDGPRQISKLSSSNCGANVTKEKAGVSSSHNSIEQELNSSHGSHEEHEGISRSFSFCVENQLASDLDHAEVVVRKGQWLFGPSSLLSEDLQLKRPEDNRATGFPEATKLALPLGNTSIFQEACVEEARATYISRSQCSPFFGTENFDDESANQRISENHSEPACIDMKGNFKGDMNTKALLVGSSFDQAQQEKASSLLGGHELSRSESNLMVEGIEGKERMFPLSRWTVSVNNSKAIKPSIRSSMRMCPPEGTQLNHADGNCVTVDNWKAFYPSTRSNTHRCPADGARLHHTVDGNLCFSTCSIGSCSKRDANLVIEDPSTSVDARSGSTAQEKPAALPLVALPNILHSYERMYAVSNDGESKGKEAIGWEGPGKQNTWLRRWRSGRVQDVSMREGRVLAGMTRGRNYFEDYSKVQGNKESSFDHLRLAKRVCYEERSGPKPHIWNAISKNSEKGVVSHFMKRFFTPSATAMAIMGMTARKVHAAQPQRRGLFGGCVWNDSIRKPPVSWPELSKEFLNTPKSEQESLLVVAAKAQL